MRSLPEICRQLFLLARTAVLPHTRGRGSAWERMVFDLLAARMVPVESAPGGFQVCGHSSLSGLSHQLDAVFGGPDAMIVAEWKAHHGPIPKNEFLRFKAASDDYLMALARFAPSRPVVRIFGGPGKATVELRRYAALHGIVMLDSLRWPAPVLASSEFRWPVGTACPGEPDRRLLAWGVRPWQSIMRPVRDGFVIEVAASSARVDAFLRAHEYWSNQLWRALARDTSPRTAARDRSDLRFEAQRDGLLA